MPVHPLLYRLKDLTVLVSLSRMTIEREIAAGRFPAPIILTACTKAWRHDDISAWLDALPRQALP